MNVNTVFIFQYNYNDKEANNEFGLSINCHISNYGDDIIYLNVEQWLNMQDT